MCILFCNAFRFIHNDFELNAVIFIVVKRKSGNILTRIVCVFRQSLWVSYCKNMNKFASKKNSSSFVLVEVVLFLKQTILISKEIAPIKNNFSRLFLFSRLFFFCYFRINMHRCEFPVVCINHLNICVRQFYRIETKILKMLCMGIAYFMDSLIKISFFFTENCANILFCLNFQVKHVQRSKI